MFKPNEKVFVVMGTYVGLAIIIEKRNWDTWRVVCEGIDMDIRAKNLRAATPKNARRIKNYLIKKIAHYTEELKVLQETLEIFKDV